MLPATEPHRDVKIKATSFSVRRAMSLRIQNTRSHIPLCLQFLYSTEGNKGTTVIWLQYHGAPRWWETSHPMWPHNLRQYRALEAVAGNQKKQKKNKLFDVFTLNEKKKTCSVPFFDHFRGTVGVTDSRLQTRAYLSFMHFTAFLRFVLVLV